MFRAAFTLAAAVAGISVAQAATLEVGVGKRYATIGAAAAAAAPYDTIIVHPGTYRGARFSDSNLTVRTPAGSARGSVIITGPTIGDKGLFVTRGSNITIDGFRFTGATSTSRNGAGIRAEGLGLTVRNSEFVGNESGMLVTPIVRDAGTVTIRNSLFRANGYGDGQSHGVYVNSADKLVVESSRFEGTRVGHHLKSRANINEIRHSSFVDTDMAKAASYHIDLPNGGAATIESNTFIKGRNSSNGCCSIALGFEGASNPVGPLVVRNNHLTNQRSTSTTFVVNRTTVPASLSSNSFTGIVRRLAGNGAVNGTIARRPPAGDNVA